MAAASPAGPPPITKTSVTLSIDGLLIHSVIDPLSIKPLTQRGVLQPPDLPLFLT
jgi:hypothetical protein